MGGLVSMWEGGGVARQEKWLLAVAGWTPALGGVGLDRQLEIPKTASRDPGRGFRLE